MSILEERMVRFNNIDIYPVISSGYTANRPVLDVLRAIADGGARIVQLREKTCTKLELYRLAEKYREITAHYNMLLMINDHLDIAQAVGADGVHLGQDDLPIPIAKQLFPDLILGASSHNHDEAIEAEKQGADYINIGPVYTTQTKEVGYPALGIDGLQETAACISTPYTVMGGIKAKHIPKLVTAGANHIAMVTQITEADDIAETVRELRKLFCHP